MSRKAKIITYFAINLALPIIAIFVIVSGSFLAQSPYNQYINCPSVLLFDIYCPFCGITRAMGALLSGKIVTAFIYNPAFVLFIPCFLYYDVVILINMIKKKETLPNIPRWLIITLCAILIANWILRNVLLVFFNIDYLAALAILNYNKLPSPR